ncbi:hypothetical protein NGA_2085520, partial [Nannochloropsis gaditana CCMP526]|uniref:uncharacterized protein n=1 Tax=Nannochloropsis gaditana (strain CCMP526) TaxID=1093141 RepID=UPI00029F62FD
RRCLPTWPPPQPAGSLGDASTRRGDAPARIYSTIWDGNSSRVTGHFAVVPPISFAGASPGFTPARHRPPQHAPCLFQLSLRLAVAAGVSAAGTARSRSSPAAPGLAASLSPAKVPASWGPRPAVESARGSRRVRKNTRRASIPGHA